MKKQSELSPQAKKVLDLMASTMPVQATQNQGDVHKIFQSWNAPTDQSYGSATTSTK